MPTNGGPTWSDTYFTDAGLLLRTEVIAEKGSIEFTRAEVGEGKPANPADIAQYTGLVNFKEPVYVEKSARDEQNDHTIVVNMDNKAFLNRVLVTEIGIYAKKIGTDTEVLYAYVYALVGAAELPAATSSKRSWRVVFKTKISQSDQVTIVYDGTIVHPTYADLDDAIANHNTDPEAHGDKVTRNTKFPYPTAGIKDFDGLPAGYCKVGDFANEMANAPNPSFNGEVFTNDDTMGLITQTAIHADAKSIWFRTHNADGRQPWVKLATAEPPRMYTLNFVSGVVVHRDSTYCKNDFNQVHIHLSCKKSAGNFANGEIVAVLPEGFRPPIATEVQVAFFLAPNNASGTVIVHPNGTIIVHPASFVSNFVVGDLFFYIE